MDVIKYVGKYLNTPVGQVCYSTDKGINKALARNTYLTGHHLNVTDVAAYHVLYPLIEQLSITEQESLLHLCRWSKHIQAQPKVSGSRPPLSLNTILLSSFAPAVH
ncbi:hypothetical protein KGM_208328 [Danaus plexippus plexippus]|uniref:Nuclear-export cofactor Arc1-like N-terminal domain-containing protein n=1 Tax=Danaus plexippus plexippus TaxID=278856 RepID=A0A212FJS7_DANPL|nr:hypothetical protein KGM_208328 [Danaus plexippus plexippus]